MVIPMKIHIMKTFRSTTVIFICLTVSITIIQGCGTSQKKQAAENTGTSAITEAFTLGNDSLASFIRIPGELVPFFQVDLYAKVSSFVKTLHADAGSEVSQGQLLAVMEAPEISSQLLAAESRLKSQEAIYLASKSTYDRLLETSKTPGTVSQNDLDLALAKQKSDLAQLEAARAAYNEITDTRNYLEIRAPFSGVVTARNVSAGAYVGPSGKGSEMPMFTLQEKKKLRLVVSVPEAYVSYLDTTTEVEFTVRSLPSQVFRARVSRQSGALDTRLRAERVEMDVMNDNKKLLAGMVAEVTIPLAAHTEAFIVPSTAVLNSTEGVFVIRVENGKTIWVPVTKGRSEGGKTEIFGKLAIHDVLITRASEEIRNGSPAPQLKMP